MKKDPVSSFSSPTKRRLIPRYFSRTPLTSQTKKFSTIIQRDARTHAVRTTASSFDFLAVESKARRFWTSELSINGDDLYPSRCATGSTVMLFSATNPPQAPRKEKRILRIMANVSLVNSAVNVDWSNIALQSIREKIGRSIEECASSPVYDRTTNLWQFHFLLRVFAKDSNAACVRKCCICTFSLCLVL